jgi:hypothetical protein
MFRRAQGDVLNSMPLRKAGFRTFSAASASSTDHTAGAPCGYHRPRLRKPLPRSSWLVVAGKSPAAFDLQLPYLQLPLSPAAYLQLGYLIWHLQLPHLQLPRSPATLAGDIPRLISSCLHLQLLSPAAISSCPISSCLSPAAYLQLGSNRGSSSWPSTPSWSWFLQLPRFGSAWCPWTLSLGRQGR